MKKKTSGWPVRSATDTKGIKRKQLIPLVVKRCHSITHELKIGLIIFSGVKRVFTLAV